MKWIYSTIHDEDMIREQVWLNELILHRRGNEDTWVNEAIEWGRKELGVGFLTIARAQSIDLILAKLYPNSMAKSNVSILFMNNFNILAMAEIAPSNSLGSVATTQSSLLDH